MLDIRGHELFDGDLVIRNSLGGELNYCIVVGDKTFTMKKRFYRAWRWLQRILCKLYFW